MADPLFPIPPAALLQLRTMPRSVAAQFLRQWPELAPDQIEALLSRASTNSITMSSPRVVVHDPSRRTFAAMAWIAGASFNQLAALFEVSRQTVIDQVNRLLPAHKREAYDGRRTKLSFDRLAVMYDHFRRDPGAYGSDLEAGALMLWQEAEE